MFKKKISIILVMAVLSTFLVYGCGSSSSSESSSAENTDKEADTDSGDAVDYGSLSLTMGSTGATDDISTQAMEYMKEYIEEKSDGAVTLDLYPASQLGSATDLMEMTGQGSVDLFLEANYMSVFGVEDSKAECLVFTSLSKDDYRKINESDLCQEWKDKFCEANNINIISSNWYRNGAALISNVEINSVEDLKGIKVRVPQVDITMQCFEEIGMVPTPIAYSESLLALQQGIVDAIMCTEDAAYTMGFYEVADYVIELNSYYDAMFVYMNDDLFHNVTDAQRELIIEAADAAGDYYSSLADQALTESVEAMKEAGLIFSQFTDEEMAELQDKMKDVADTNEAEGNWTKGTYDKVLEIIGK